MVVSFTSWCGFGDSEVIQDERQGGDEVWLNPLVHWAKNST